MDKKWQKVSITSRALSWYTFRDSIKSVNLGCILPVMYSLIRSDLLCKLCLRKSFGKCFISCFPHRMWAWPWIQIWTSLYILSGRRTENRMTSCAPHKRNRTQRSSRMTYELRVSKLTWKNNGYTVKQWKKGKVKSSWWDKLKMRWKGEMLRKWGGKVIFSPDLDSTFLVVGGVQWNPSLDFIRSGFRSLCHYGLMALQSPTILSWANPAGYQLRHALSWRSGWHTRRSSWPCSPTKKSRESCLSDFNFF